MGGGVAGGGCMTRACKQGVCANANQVTLQCAHYMHTHANTYDDVKKSIHAVTCATVTWQTYNHRLLKIRQGRKSTVETQTRQEIDSRNSDMLGNRPSKIRHVHCTIRLHIARAWHTLNDEREATTNGKRCDRTSLIQWHTRIHIMCKGWDGVHSCKTWHNQYTHGWSRTHNIQQIWCHGAKLQVPTTGTSVNHQCNTCRHNKTHIWPTVMHCIQHTW